MQEQKREMAIFRILGSRQSYLFILVIGEVAVIGAIGIGLGVVLGQLITSYAVVPFITPMLAERLADAGIGVFAVDFRKDKSDDPAGNNDTENAAQNFDHAWATPILEHLVDSVLAAYPGRKISIVVVLGRLDDRA